MASQDDSDQHKHDTTPAPADCCEPCDDQSHDAWRAAGQLRKSALHITIHCSVRGCRNRQALGFEKESETYGELLEAIRGQGWVLQMMGTNPEEARCPPCEKALRAAVATVRLEG